MALATKKRKRGRYCVKHKMDGCTTQPTFNKNKPGETYGSYSSKYKKDAHKKEGMVNVVSRKHRPGAALHECKKCKTALIWSEWIQNAIDKEEKF